jgi:predicted lipid-binding transport protein (Tim44 family)
MKQLLSLLAMVFTFGLATVATDAEAAKRMGSGKSIGTQRQATVEKAPATPAQSAAAAGSPAAGAAATPSRSWMGPVAGIAAGLGLAALASHLGFGEELATMLMFGLLAAAIMVAVGFFMRKRAASAQPSRVARTGGMQYAHVIPGDANNGRTPSEVAPVYKVAMPAAGNDGGAVGTDSYIGSGLGSKRSTTRRIPADFDSAGFEHNAKVNFIRLQAANDAGNLDDIRQFTTPEMFAELTMDLAERGSTPQKTDVLGINAEVIEVDEDADSYLISVRFTGVIRDNGGQPDESFDEIWHLIKARRGNSGWILSGIQQTH